MNLHSKTPATDRAEVSTRLPLAGPSDRRVRYRQLLAFQISPDSVVKVVWALVMLGLLVYPIYWLTREAVIGPDGTARLGNFAELLRTPFLVRAIRNSLILAVAATLGALAIGLPLAYLVSRTDMPGRWFFRNMSVLTIATPSFITALGWIMLLGPNQGLINSALRSLFSLEQAPLNIFSEWGVIFVVTMFIFPFVLLPIAAAFDGMDTSLEAAAHTLGATRLEVLRRVSLPLVKPAILGGCLLVFVTSATIFGPVAILGSPVGFDTIPTALFRLMRFPPRIDMAAVVATPTLLGLLGLLAIRHRLLGKGAYSVITGKPSSRTRVALGRWRWLACGGCTTVFLISVVAPFVALVLTATRRSLGFPLGRDNFVLTENFIAAVTSANVITAFRNSLLLATFGVASALTIAMLSAWIIERAKGRLARFVSPVMSAPLALPGSIIGIALILAFAREPFRLAGSLKIIFIAYVILTLPLAFLYVHAGIKQISPEMEEAARTAGAGWSRTVGRITAPLMAPTLLAVGMLKFVALFRELDASIFLFQRSNVTLSVVLFNLADEARFTTMAALSIIVISINVGVIAAGSMLGRQRGMREVGL